MKFNQTLKNNLNDTNLSPHRRKLLKQCESNISNLKEMMFDVYGIEKIYLLESFYDNDKPYIDKVPVLIRMNYSDFCALADSKCLNYSNLDIFVETNDGIYSIGKDKLKPIEEGSLHHDKIL